MDKIIIKLHSYKGSLMRDKLKSTTTEKVDYISLMTRPYILD